MWYEQVEPFGELREDWRVAMLASHIANTGYDTSKRGPFGVEEFLLKFGKKKGEMKQTPEQQIRVLNTLAMIMNVKE